MSTAEWNQFVRALQALQRNGTYDEFTRSHGTDEFQWHRGQYFLPAHRQMLWELEDELRKVSPGVTIPYYDWSINNDRWMFDSVWSLVGGADGGPIPNEPFSGLRSPVPNDHLVTRVMVAGSNTNGDGAASSSFESRAALDVQIADTEQSFQRFSNYVEMLHGLPHIEIGGDMSNGFFSPSDPVFYLHHAFIDKIWRDWQLAGANDKFDGFHRGVAVSASERIRPTRWGRSVTQIMDSLSPCVVYQEASRRPANNGRAQLRSGVAGGPNPAREEAIAKEKAADGEAYKEKVQKVKNSQQDFLKGATFSGLPDDIVQDALKTKKKIQSQTQDVLPSDVKNPDEVLGKSAADVQTEGEKEAEKLAGSGSS